MRSVLLLLLTLTTFSATAGEEALIGIWEGGDTAAMSIYGNLKIAKQELTWGRGKQKCRANYTIQKEESGTPFKDQIGRIHLTSPDLDSFLLKMKAGKCAAGVTHLRLTFALKNNRDYLDMVEYAGLERPAGYMHFHRRDPK